MSKVAISGNASGTGVFTVASPNSNVDRTLTLPDETGTVITTTTPGVPVNGPAFSAYGNTPQTFSSAAYTKVILNTKEFDTNSCFDSAVNYRFTPTVAGYYQFNWMSFPPSTSRAGEIQTFLYKNGSPFKSGIDIISTSTIMLGGAALAYANGTTDYFEFYLYVQTSGTVTGQAAYMFFQAAMIRSA